MTQSKVETRERHLGIEIEFSGVDPDRVLQSIQEIYGGTIKQKSVFEQQVIDSRVGDFTLELDAQLLKQLVDSDSEQGSLKAFGENLLKSAAEQLVPWEVVTPPLPMSELADCERLISSLREQGALGTRHAVRYAFGLHLNPELPDLRATTIVSFLQAYLCLYDWVLEQEKVDLVRRMTPYIDHFPNEYIDLVIDAGYYKKQELSDNDTHSQPWIDDYLAYNPTRNRGLDCLPLIGHLNKERVQSLPEKELIKPRPTFHYRLPNSDIDNPDWNLSYPWELWLVVEKLANNRAALDRFCLEFQNERQRLIHRIDRHWIAQCERLLNEFELAPKHLSGTLDQS